MKKVCVVGHFAFGKKFSDGQTVKTHSVYNELKRIYGENEVTYIDTNGWKKGMPVMILKFIAAFFKCSNVVILPAQNGVKLMVPLSSMMRKIRKTRVHYVVVGGWLPELASEKSYIKKGLAKLYRLYVESADMLDNLKKCGCSNTVVMPNFKRVEVFTSPKVFFERNEHRMCTFSRVVKEKGIGEAVEAAAKLNEKYPDRKFLLDIYGQVFDEQREWFEKLKESFGSTVRYRGVVDFEKSTAVLREYDVLLFPTYHSGEGFAGTLIDAMSAGIPVVATDWKYNKDVITDNENGLLVSPGSIDELAAAVEKLFSDVELQNKMSRNNIKKALAYTPENVISILTDNLL